MGLNARTRFGQSPARRRAKVVPTHNYRYGVAWYIVVAGFLLSLNRASDPCAMCLLRRYRGAPRSCNVRIPFWWLMVVVVGGGLVDETEPVKVRRARETLNFIANSRHHTYTHKEPWRAIVDGPETCNFSGHFGVARPRLFAVIIQRHCCLDWSLSRPRASHSPARSCTILRLLRPFGRSKINRYWRASFRKSLVFFFRVFSRFSDWWKKSFTKLRSCSL